MVSPSPFAETRIAGLRRTYAPATLAKADLLADDYLLARYEAYRVYFAPFGSWPEPEARVILVGLTPGETQTREAAAAYLETPANVRDDLGAFSNVLRHRVAFKGSMRVNLCSMLDQIDFPGWFGARQSSELFEESRAEVATTSALIYPVFMGSSRRNFSGGGIDLAKIPLFRDMLDELLAPRLVIAPDAMIIPLGKAAASGLGYLCERGVVSRRRVLPGMPHPSGANGHRFRQFAESRDAMRSSVESWFSR